MATIKTTLITCATDDNGNIQLSNPIQLNNPDRSKAFGGIYQIGLIMGSQDKDTRRLPVDDKDLTELKRTVNGVIESCLFSLAGLGGFIASCQPVDSLNHDSLYGVGSIIQNLALLAQESMDHLESIEMDSNSRNQAKEGNHD